VRNISLAAILVAAAAARLVGINFGLPHLNCRPDEGAVVSIAGGLYSGDLNPHVFNYPAFFMLTIAIVLVMLKTSGLVAAIASTTAYRVARYLSAAAGIASVLMIFRIGLRLFGQTAALAGAALLSLAFLHVRDSHFGVTDVPMTFLVLVAFLFIVRLSESGETKDLIAAGVAAGLATSTKYNAALIALPAMLVIFTGNVDAQKAWHGRFRRAALFGSMMMAAYFLTSPYTLLDYPQFIRDFTFETRHLEAGHGSDLGRGWSHHLVSTLRYGVGAPILVSGVAGFALLLWKDRRRGLLVALFPVTYYLLLGSGRTVFARYMLPVVPFLCLAAGYAITEAASWLAARVGRQRLAPIMVAAGVVGAVWPSAQSVIAFDRLISLDDNRLLARRWVEQHFPKDTTVAQIGTPSGHVFLHDLNEPKYLSMSMRNQRNRPDLIIVQSSPLAPVARELRRIEGVLATEYELAFDRNGVGSDPANVYDWQDEFFLPLTGFKGIERPGPDFKIYIRRDAFPKVPRLADASVSVR
jgi:hypothetical protein